MPIGSLDTSAASGDRALLERAALAGVLADPDVVRVVRSWPGDSGVRSAAAAGGVYDVAVRVVARPVPLKALGERLAGSVSRAAGRAGAPLGRVDVEFVDVEFVDVQASR